MNGIEKPLLATSVMTNAGLLSKNEDIAKNKRKCGQTRTELRNPH